MRPPQQPAPLRASHWLVCGRARSAPRVRGRQPVEAGTCGAAKAAQASVSTRLLRHGTLAAVPLLERCACVKTLRSPMGVWPGEYDDVDAISWGTSRPCDLRSAHMPLHGRAC